MRKVRKRAIIEVSEVDADAQGDKSNSCDTQPEERKYNLLIKYKYMRMRLEIN